VFISFYFPILSEPFFGVAEDGKLKGIVCGWCRAEGGKLKSFSAGEAIIPGGLLLDKEY
jgi:hypothetical protein